MNYKLINDVPFKRIVRFSTGYSNIDEMFGGGMPWGAVSFFAGEGGTGKSRLALNIASHVNKREKAKVLYFQLEMDLSMFKGYTKKLDINTDSFAVSNVTKYEDVVSAIRSYQPKFVVIDSVNMLTDSGNIHVVRKMMKEFIKVAQELNCHIVLIGQLGKDGNVKGSTDWVYLPDIVCHLNRVKMDKKIVDRIFSSVKGVKPYVVAEKRQKWENYINKELKSRFLISIPNKNRFGSTGGIVTMKHFDDKIRQINGQSSFDHNFAQGVPYPKVVYRKTTSKQNPIKNRVYKPVPEKNAWENFKNFCMSLQV